jgi:hypothetical protein
VITHGLKLKGSPTELAFGNVNDSRRGGLQRFLRHVATRNSASRLVRFRTGSEHGVPRDRPGIRQLSATSLGLTPVEIWAKSRGFG